MFVVQTSLKRVSTFKRKSGLFGELFENFLKNIFEILGELLENLGQIFWEFFENSFGIFWEFCGNFVAIL